MGVRDYRAPHLLCHRPARILKYSESASSAHLQCSVIPSCVGVTCWLVASIDGRLRSGWRRLPVVLLLCCGVMLAACQPTNGGGGAQAQGVVKRFGKPPLALELRLDRERLTVAERLHLELRAESEEAYAVKFGEVKDLPGFGVLSASEGKPELVAANRVAVSFHYVLEPLAAGRAQIPGLKVEAWKKAEAEAAVTTVATEAVEVVVESLLAQDDPGDTISDIAPPLAKPLGPWLWIGSGLAALLVLVLMVYLWRRGKKAVPPPPPLPPHLLAYQALDRLLATDLLASGQVKAFFEALSDILRHYIEDRFGVRAPEQTTEEFLTALGPMGAEPMARLRSPTLATMAHKLLLGDFLRHCDLVKFARHTPTRVEAEERVELCRRFVRETEPALRDETKSGGAA